MFWSGRTILVGMMFIAVLSMHIRSVSADDATRPTSAPSTDIATLIADLNSDSYQTRQASQEKLIAMGEAAEPQIKAALGGPLSAEAHTRLAAVLDRIEQSNPMTPTLITLHYTNAPVIDILRDFQKQSHADMGADDPSLLTFLQDKTASINLDRTDFWEALAEVADATGLGINSALQFSRTRAPDWLGAPGARSGAFFVAPVGCQRVASVQYGDQTVKSASLVLTLRVCVEPKLQIVRIDTPDWLKECIDDKGLSLAPTVNRIPLPMLTLPRMRVWSFYTVLNIAPGMGAKIATLKGEIHCKLPFKSEVVDLDDPAQVTGLTRVVDGMTIKFTGWQKSQPGMAILGVICTGDLGSDGMAKAISEMSDMEITDDQGRVLRGDIPSGGQQADGVTMTFRFRQPGPMKNDTPAPLPKKFHWEYPSETKDMTIPFELHDIELPHS